MKFSAIVIGSPIPRPGNMYWEASQTGRVITEHYIEYVLEISLDMGNRMRTVCPSKLTLHYQARHTPDEDRMVEILKHCVRNNKYKNSCPHINRVNKDLSSFQVFGQKDLKKRNEYDLRERNIIKKNVSTNKKSNYDIFRNLDDLVIILQL